MDEIKLPVKAKDNHGYEYDVVITRAHPDPSRIRSGAPILKIKGTPGSWYFEDLMKDPSRQVIAIDMGQGWNVINFRAVMVSAMSVI
jgi:hypothetical protein